MYHKCSTEKGVQKQRRIEQGLMELMKQYPYEDITVSMLTNYLQIPRKTFYRHYGCKDDALYALLDHTLMDYEQLIVQRLPYHSRTEIESYFEFWGAHGTLLDALNQNNLSGMLTQFAIRKALQEHGSWSNLHSVDTPSEKDALVFTVSGMYSLMMNWYQNGCNRSPKQMAEISIQLLMQPMFQEL